MSRLCIAGGVVVAVAIATTLLVFVGHSNAEKECAAAVATTDAEAKHKLMPDLPPDHLRRYLSTFPQLKSHCSESVADGNENEHKGMIPCWGHEHDCDAARRFQTPVCPHIYSGLGQSKQAQVTTFYYQADFGYVQQQIDELSLICEPEYRSDSSLLCSRYLRFCRGRNLRFDFRDLLQRRELIRYNMDVLRPGQVGGHCRLNRTRLNGELDHMGALQSWAPELRNFAELPEAPLTHNQCDEIVETPTFVLKIDATYNMYHHFCDFFNLYASLFINQSHPLAFDTDTRILIWETYPYDSPFAATFKAFSRHPVWTLNEVKGKRICFRNVVLPLLPRMIFGLYYNTPLIFGCQNSGLFRAFSEFILHRMQIPYEPPAAKADRVRITFLARRTKYRRVLNEDELIDAIAANSSYQVRRISFENGLDFTEQLAITRNSDVLIGMHGAGLTHLLFLPNWAAIFELYNCEDANCYKDLARLRGVRYLTWERNDLVYPQDAGHHPQGGAHAKFTNYAFDRDEFVRQVGVAAEAVRMHPEYQQYGTVKVPTERDEL